MVPPFLVIRSSHSIGRRTKAAVGSRSTVIWKASGIRMNPISPMS